MSAGADLISFSGDKLLGGPQAGILLGSAHWIGRLKRHPLARAVRLDKMTLAALEATLESYLDPQSALSQIPTLRMLALSPRSCAAAPWSCAGFWSAPACAARSFPQQAGSAAAAVPPSSCPPSPQP